MTIKLSLLAGYMILLIENSSLYQKTIITNEFSKAAGYKMYRNLLPFYTLIINYQNEKTWKQPQYNHIKKNKKPRNKLNQGGERPILQKL